MGEIVAAVGPHLLWMLFLLGVVALLGPARIRQLLARLSSVEVSGVRINLASEVKSAGIERNMTVTREASEAVAARLQVVRPRMAEARFLWIDDYPENNKVEMRILKALGATIDLARSDEEARTRLNSAVYDIVLSDINRGGQADAGVRFLDEALGAILNPKVIFYVADAKEPPRGAYGITTQPDGLMDLIASALMEARRT